MTDDLIKRAREAAEPWDYGEPDTLITELADRIEAQAGVIVGLRAQLHMVLDREADTLCRHDAKVEAQAAEIERLREAGNDLGFYAGHEDACDCVKGWAKGPCNCGYTEAWQAWHSLAGKAEQ
jgi:hypothetical protein